MREAIKTLYIPLTAQLTAGLKNFVLVQQLY